MFNVGYFRNALFALSSKKWNWYGLEAQPVGRTAPRDNWDTWHCVDETEIQKILVDRSSNACVQQTCKVVYFDQGKFRNSSPADNGGLPVCEVSRPDNQLKGMPEKAHSDEVSDKLFPLNGNESNLLYGYAERSDPNGSGDEKQIIALNSFHDRYQIKELAECEPEVGSIVACEIDGQNFRVKIKEIFHRLEEMIVDLLDYGVEKRIPYGTIKNILDGSEEKSAKTSECGKFDQKVALPPGIEMRWNDKRQAGRVRSEKQVSSVGCIYTYLQLL